MENGGGARARRGLSGRDWGILIGACVFALAAMYGLGVLAESGAFLAGADPGATRAPAGVAPEIEGQSCTTGSGEYLTFTGRVRNRDSVPIRRVRVYGQAIKGDVTNDWEASVDAFEIAPGAAATFKFLVRQPGGSTEGMRCRWGVVSWDRA